MIIMKTDATEEDIRRVVLRSRRSGLRADVSRGEYITVMDQWVTSAGRLMMSWHLPGVKEASMVEAPYKLSVATTHGSR
jgi:3-deoxy-7-phosphoheptulonate synthase